MNNHKPSPIESIGEPLPAQSKINLDNILARVIFSVFYVSLIMGLCLLGRILG
ncbi:MAG: hypothetical protein MI750_11065 [Xanthomonadales bacterium]|jgi:hypothetical protein|nr:hypothetical protein [Xanthomonadales bacterium]